MIDTHCHLDFPDFAEDLPAYVARAEAAGVGRMVTISTRVARFADYAAIAERFPSVWFSVGTHPHQAHEELDVTAERLVDFLKDPAGFRKGFGQFLAHAHGLASLPRKGKCDRHLLTSFPSSACL